MTREERAARLKAAREHQQRERLERQLGEALVRERDAQRRLENARAALDAAWHEAGGATLHRELIEAQLSEMETR